MGGRKTVGAVQVQDQETRSSFIRESTGNNTTTAMFWNVRRFCKLTEFHSRNVL